MDEYSLVRKGNFCSDFEGATIPIKNYYQIISEVEKKDINWTLNSMAKDSFFSLSLNYKELQNAGDRIKKIHPLRYLNYIFINSELKSLLQEIQSRSGWVWREFISGLVKGMMDEASLGNMKQEYLEDFASTLGVEIQLINYSFQNSLWEEFVDTLITLMKKI